VGILITDPQWNSVVAFAEHARDDDMGLTPLRYPHSGVDARNNQLFTVSADDLPELARNSRLVTHPQLSREHHIVLCPLGVFRERPDCKIKENGHSLTSNLPMRASLTPTPSS